jgi:hypothetical protein
MARNPVFQDFHFRFQDFHFREASLPAVQREAEAARFQDVHVREIALPAVQRDGAEMGPDAVAVYAMDGMSGPGITAALGALDPLL